MMTLAIQIDKLDKGELRQRMGLDYRDVGHEAGSSAPGQDRDGAAFAAVKARGRAETKQSLIKQAVASFYLTYLTPLTRISTPRTLKSA